MLKYFQYCKSDDEDGPVKEIPRDPAFGASRKLTDGVPITSEPEGRKHMLQAFPSARVKG